MSDNSTDQKAPSDQNDTAWDSEIDGERPDVRTRFQPGQSGNTRGRPKGARGRKQMIEEIARETHVVTDGEKRQRRTTLELVLLSLRNQSIDGNIRAFRLNHALLQKYAPQHDTNIEGGFLLLPAPVTRAEWEKQVYEQQRKARGEPHTDSDGSAA